MSKFVGLMELYDLSHETLAGVETAYSTLCYVNRMWMPKKSIAERKLFIVDAWNYANSHVPTCHDLTLAIKTLTPGDEFDASRKRHYDAIADNNRDLREATKQRKCLQCYWNGNDMYCSDCPGRDHSG